MVLKNHPCMAAMLFFLSATFCLADLHIIREEVAYRKDFSRKSSRTIEIWRAKDKEYYVVGNIVTITRHDLKKVWLINWKEMRYTESALNQEKNEDVSSRSKTVERLHNEGYDYAPSFDWKIEKTELQEAVAGLQCQKFLIDGDAEFAEKFGELWVTDNVGIDAKRYGNIDSYFKISLLTYGNEPLPVFPELRGLYVVSAKVTTDPSIVTQQSVLESRTIKVEEAVPPVRIYELPEGFNKVETEKELWNDWR